MKIVINVEAIYNEKERTESQAIGTCNVPVYNILDAKFFP